MIHLQKKVLYFAIVSAFTIHRKRNAKRKIALLATSFALVITAMNLNNQLK